MNFKTTLVLLVLLAAVLGLVWGGGAVAERLGLAAPAVESPPSAALGTLETLTPEAITLIEVKRGDTPVAVLERTAGGEWVLPGNWPARPAEVKGLVDLVAGLRSRFEAEQLQSDEGWAKYGLDKPALTLRVKAGDKEHTLALGDPPAGEGNRFSRPTYLRVDGGSEAVRLAPGLVALLDRPADYYQQRRLFPSERVAREPGSAERVEQLAAQGLATQDAKPAAPAPGEPPAGDGSFALAKAGDEWVMGKPVKDRVDPDRLRAVLGAVPDVWAEQFVPRPYKPLAEYGLEPPEQTLTVTRPGGGTTTLLVGKVSPTVRERRVTRPAPPGMPVPPQTETVRETYRYAKLKDNEQIFEIKADRLKDIFTPAKELRDARLARFRPEDARRLEVKAAGQDIVLVRDKERWKLEKPVQADAETAKVNDLLDKLSGLQARDADVLDKADPMAQGFDDPAKVGTIRVQVEEERGEGEAKTKKAKEFTFALGKHDEDKKKLLVKVQGWDRVNSVEDSLVNLVKRPALAYRGRRVLDFSAADLASLQVARAGEAVALAQDKGEWKLTAPVAAPADPGKAGGLAGTLGSLEATEYVNDAPKPEELEKYGLAKSPVKATLTFTPESKKPAKALLVGAERADKPGEHYAKIDGEPSVFAVRKDVKESLDQPSLAYRPLDVWRVSEPGVKALDVQQAGKEPYRLTRKDGGWQVTGPFEAAAVPNLVEPIVTELTGPRGERYEVHKAEDLKKYGLDAPHLKVTVESIERADRPADKPAGKPGDKPAAPQETIRQRVLLVGGPTEKDPKARYAKLGDSDGVFVVGDKLLAAVDKGALDLLDRRLLTLDRGGVEKVQLVKGDQKLTLEKKDKAWQVTESPAGAAFAADERAVAALLGSLGDLEARRFAAYGPKADAAAYGLDKPEVTATVTVKGPGKEPGKPEVKTHTLALGKVAEGSTGERFARLDNGPGIAVLPTATAADLARTYLDYVDHKLLTFDPAKLKGLVRTQEGSPLEVAKADDEWKVVKPAAQKADEKTLGALAERLGSLRAERVAAYPAADLKAFGLEPPAAVVTLQTEAGGKPASTALRIGKPVADKPGAGPAERYVQVEGSKVVGVLPGDIVESLLAGPLKFRDRAVARFPDADRAVLERGPRKAAFAKKDGTWKLVEPLEADAEQLELDDFVNALARLRADEWVAEKPADLKPYGLDKPEAHWTFKDGSRTVLDLLVGGKDSQGRAYAKLANGDLVFVLDPTATGRVLAEYRKRGVWPTPPDAAQVDRVRYGYQQTPFVLEKRDGAWSVEGRPGAKVNTQAVNDALAALGGLRIERYVADKGADLKLYGLAPAELTLEVQAPGGKREVLIGRPEGDSKRVYARVADGNGDVFVLSEADAARIVRDLSGFLEKPDKPAEKPAGDKPAAAKPAPEKIGRELIGTLPAEEKAAPGKQP